MIPKEETCHLKVKYFQQERFKSILPCILIIWIHKAFKDGTLKKINGKTLHTTLKLPTYHGSKIALKY